MTGSGAAAPLESYPVKVFKAKTKRFNIEKTILVQMIEMAREIKSLIRLNAKQTGEFLASLSSRKNAKNRAKTLARIKRTKFNVVL